MLENVVKTKITLSEACESIGIRYEIRPLWGALTDRQNMPMCNVRWGISYLLPDTEEGRLVFYEGQCGAFKYYNVGGQQHEHGQAHDVIDLSDTAMLVTIRQWYKHKPDAYYTKLLIGMDDGEPYVHPTMRKFTKLQDVFDWLVPKDVWEQIVLGKDCPRQGDWYFVPFEWPKSDVRLLLQGEAKRVKFTFDGQSRYLYHYLDNNRDVIFLDCPLLHGYFMTRHRAEECIYRADGHHFVRGLVTAPDHPDIHLEDWHKIYRTVSSPGGRRDNSKDD